MGSYFKEAQKSMKQNAAPAKGQIAASAPAPLWDDSKKLLPWRSQLQEAYLRKHKSIKKGEISYEIEQVDPPKPSFVATVSSEKFGESYTGKAGSSKAFAEDNAAMVAMKAEFPEDFSACQAPTTEKGFRRLKRKAAEEEEAGEQTRKSIKMQRASSTWR